LSEVQKSQTSHQKQRGNQSQRHERGKEKS